MERPPWPVDRYISGFNAYPAPVEFPHNGYSPLSSLKSQLASVKRNNFILVVFILTF